MLVKKLRKILTNKNNIEIIDKFWFEYNKYYIVRLKRKNIILNQCFIVSEYSPPPPWTTCQSLSNLRRRLFDYIMSKDKFRGRRYLIVLYAN
jgi:hypothetical protein